MIAPDSVPAGEPRAANLRAGAREHAAGETFDDFAALAAQVCNAPIAFISIADGGRHRIQASVGWPFRPTTYDAALCDHALFSADGVLAVEDAGGDPRFSTDPLVVGPPHLASFAAVRVLSPEGLPLGTICVADRRPRAYAPASLKGLQRLARQLESHLSMRAAVAELHDELAARVLAPGAADGELLRAHEAAMAASRLQSEFIANVSHEIRTPINGVLGLTCALLDTHLTGLQREYGEGVKQSAEALLDIVNDILDLSKIEAGKLTIERIPFDVRRTLTRVIEPVATRARGKGLFVHVNIGADVPARILGDPVRFGQLVLNFLDNAVKFTSQGRIAVDVQVVAGWSSTGQLRVAVSDTGIGLATDKHTAVFEKFMQADSSTTRQYGGSGLGLAICRQLVSLMDGEIGVESELGKGATFWFALPLTAAPDPISDDVEDRPVAASPREGAGLRALVAEDNAVNRMVARLFLEKAGLAVDQVENGLEAIRRLETGHYDVVFLDCQMPGLDGYETARRIRSMPGLERLPIVALTASAMSGDRERCLEAGMSDYLSKPLQAAALNCALQRLVGAVAAPPAPELTGDPGFVPAEILAACGNDRASIDELIGLLERDLPAYLRDLQDALACSNWETARANAHRLRGAVGNVAAHEIEELSAKIEQALRAREVGRAIMLSAYLETAVLALMTNLRRWLDRLPEAVG